MTDRLKHMKETLMCAVEMQLCDLGEVDTKELGEAIDMIKDLEEAIYYCTVTEAMNNPQKDKEWKMDNEHSRMYYGGEYSRMMPEYPMYAEQGGRRRREDGTFYMDGGSSGNNGQNYNSNGGQNSNNQMYYGRSYNSRRMYMEAKDMKHDKATQLRELEKYMQELSQDITEMIADSSPEEKQYLEKKISALATKVGQMK